MSQQNLDLRTSIQIVRRRKKLFFGVAAAGLVIGAGYAYLTPPLTSSSAFVVVSGMPPALTNPANASATDPSGQTSLATEIVIAGSDPVLTSALPKVSPAASSLQELGKRISVTAVDGSDVLSVTATGKTASDAETTANAVANSYISYVTSATSPAVHVSAKMVAPATASTGGKLPVHIAVYAILGALAGALIGFVLCLALGRTSRRLVHRDEIANSIAVPVLASLPVERPSDPPAWARLLDQYEPDTVHGYWLSKLLRQFGAADYGVDGTRVNSPSLTVLTLASDPAALALGPQLAAFASAQGIPTALVIGPQQNMNATASLRTTCAAGAGSPAGRRKPLRLVVADDGQVEQADAAFTVVVGVVDGQQPVVPPATQPTMTVLGVSSGGATAEQLARVATAAAADGREIYGILVANPDPGDQTTGWVPRLSPVQRALPTRVNDRPTEVTR